jgi:hypothetical protein
MIFSRFSLLPSYFSPRWNLISGSILNQNSSDVWGPPVGVSVVGCHASIGHRGRRPPAARAGIKLPDRQLLSEAFVAVPKLLRCRRLQSLRRHAVRDIAASSSCR